MTEPKDGARLALARLENALVEDILAASDDEIAAEIVEVHGDPKKVAAATRAVFEKALAGMGKARLAAARAAVDASRRRPATVVALDPAAARRRLDKLMATDPEVASKLTLAARKGSSPSDADVRSMLEDLEELGIVLPHDDEGGQA